MLGIVLGEEYMLVLKTHKSPAHKVRRKLYFQLYETNLNISWECSFLPLEALKQDISGKIFVY